LAGGLRRCQAHDRGERWKAGAEGNASDSRTMPSTGGTAAEELNRCESRRRHPAAARVHERVGSDSIHLQARFIRPMAQCACRRFSRIPFPARMPNARTVAPLVPRRVARSARYETKAARGIAALAGGATQRKKHSAAAPYFDSSLTSAGVRSSETARSVIAPGWPARVMGRMRRRWRRTAAWWWQTTHEGNGAA